MANAQMGMPAAPAPEEMAVFDQMRQNISPKEFSDEMLAGASQVDPQAVAQFKSELDSLDMPAEVLDALNDLVDEILANPNKYDEIRQKYLSQGVPEDLLPEQFDPHFFAALNMAIDQMVGAPAGEKAFAKGGIAELKPINKAIASYGRNGDTMLAHITPAEARMLKRRGGAGTINPKTGLPEYFNLFKAVGKQLKAVGKAVSNFVKSDLGRVIATVALGYFLGPAAAELIGVGSQVGVAAVSGFVGSAGSTLLAGGSVRDALKAGVIGGVTAGAGSGIMGGSFQSGSYTGPTTVGGQWDQLKAAATPAPGPLQQSANTLPSGQLPATGQVTAPVQAPLPGAEFPVGDPGAGFEPYNKVFADMPAREPLTPSTVSAQPAAQAAATPTTPPGYNPQQMAAANPADFGSQPPSLMDQAKDLYGQVKDFVKTNISPSGIQQAGMGDALNAVKAQFPGVTTEQIINAPQGTGLAKAYSAAMPGMLATYGPATGVGIAALGATGGFKTKPVAMTPEAQAMQDRLAKEHQMVAENPGMFTPKGFERFGAVYNDKGQIVSWNPWSPASAGAFNQYQGGPNMAAGLASLMPVRMADGGDPKYASLTKDSSAEQIAAAYKDYVASAGGKDTQQTQQAAVDYLRNLGVSDATMQSAYQNYLGASAAPTTSAAPAAAADTAAAAARQPYLYEGLTKDSTPLQIAAAYQQFATQQGGDIKANQQAAIDYLHKLGISDPTINQAYGIYTGKGTGTTTTTVNDPRYTDLMGQFTNLQSQYAALQSRLDELTKKPTTPAPIGSSWGISPWASGTLTNNFANLVQGTPIRPTPSVVGTGQTLGIADPFAAGRVNPLSYIRRQPYNTADMYSNIMNPQPVAQPSAVVPTASVVQQPQAVDQLGMAVGGIASLRSGGYPRRTGQIEGPGTETSDEIPAMLSDGEFVMTAKAVRGAGGGSRREGAKKMYALMHRLEKNAAKG